MHIGMAGGRRLWVRGWSLPRVENKQCVFVLSAPISRGGSLGFTDRAFGVLRYKFSSHPSVGLCKSVCQVVVTRGGGAALTHPAGLPVSGSSAV